MAWHWTTARALSVFTKKDLIMTVENATKVWGITPIPALFPTKLLKPRKALTDI
jgi:hypothetical protein